MQTVEINGFLIDIELLVKKWHQRQEHYIDEAYKHADSAHNNRKFTYKAMATRDCWKELLTLLNEFKKVQQTDNQ